MTILQKRLIVLVTLGIVIACCILAGFVGVALGHVGSLVAMIVLAVLVAYVVVPAATLLERRGLPRPVAVLGVYLIGAVCLGGAGAYAAPRIVNEAAELVHNAPAMATNVQHRLNDAANDPLLAHLPVGMRLAIAKNLGAVEGVAETTAGEVGLHAVEGFRSGAEGLVRTFLVLLLAFFLVTDAERIASTILRVVPAAKRASTMAWIVDIDDVVGGFVRGQLILASITAVAVAILLSVLHVHYGTILGLVAGTASIIPLVGAIVGAVPAVIVAAATAGPVTTAILIIGLVVVFEVQGHVLTPIVIGRAVKVTPMVVFVSILAGAEIDGLLGTLIAIPVAGILRVALDRLFPANPSIDQIVEEALESAKARRVAVAEPAAATELEPVVGPSMP